MDRQPPHLHNEAEMRKWNKEFVEIHRGIQYKNK